jgi:CDP-glucose 4,6-dehydratase
MDQVVKKNLFGDFYKDRKVLITGHTGFKGSWLSILLDWLGAEVYGYALKPNTIPSLYELANIDKLVFSIISDIREYDSLLNTIKRVQPEVIIHMAAQPLVLDSYYNPRGTYEINVMGTVNLLDAVRQVNCVRVILNITTDKCYENKEWLWGYRENEPIGGFDPYSNSKGCSELVTSSFRSSFFNPKEYGIHGVAIASARAGNVIGGGDWAKNRLIPDFFRSIMIGEKLIIRNPYAIRPWQHVLEPLTGYLLLCEKLFTDGPAFAEAWNFGPDDKDAKNVEWVTKTICDIWGSDASYGIDNEAKLHEANYLKLDCSKAKNLLGWYPKWNIEMAIKYIVDWNKEYINNADMRQVCIDQIENYYFTK